MPEAGSWADKRLAHGRSTVRRAYETELLFEIAVGRAHRRRLIKWDWGA
jgi:hypothetical protein